MHYSVLQQSDNDPVHHINVLESIQIPFFMRALLLIVAFCIATDVCLAMYAGVLYLQSSQWLSLKPLPSPLERSTYIRFDELYANRSRSIVYDPIINLPRVSVQTSSRQQGKSIHYPDETLITDNGLVPAYSVKLQVSSEISTIIQFRTIDYGMENCMDCGMDATIKNKDAVGLYLLQHQTI
ncbi:protein [Lentinula edodes]|uniref:Protein n=1 Tax=Lentinula edodes TaxID=5353 RepID=A0A1Q3E7E7_LENED|nr:protein [Lentinula edodes]